MSQEFAPVGSFSERARSLRDAWEERRQVESLATHHDFVRQFRLLLVLHGWCAEALSQLAEVYGPSLQLDISPRPAAAGEDTAFQVTVAGAFSLVFGLGVRARDRETRWTVFVRQRVSAPSDNHVPAGPPRGRWTRVRVEELVLALVSAYERSRTEAERRMAPAPAERQPGTGGHAAAG